MDRTESPQVVPVKPSRLSESAIWIVPIVAALIVGWLALKTELERGPTVTIRFRSAGGIEAGKTVLKYKDVKVGTIKSVSFSPNGDEVIATAELAREFGSHLVEDTQFWVVKPRIAGGIVSGLDTLLSGIYIGVDVGKSTKGRHDFLGLESAPVITAHTPGTAAVLHGGDAGSLEVGSPIFFRRLPAGQVTARELEADGVKVTVFVNAPFDQYLNANTRFWQASGVDVSVNASGISIDTQSLASILIGGIAFDTPTEAAPIGHLTAPSTFRLFGNRGEAMKNPEKEKLEFKMVFDESVRGLEPGAPVDFLGVPVGEVSSVRAQMSAGRRRVLIAVQATIYPSRIRWEDKDPGAGATLEQRRRLIDKMVATGMRAQLRPASLVTPNLYLALDFFPPRKSARVKWATNPPELPTQPAALVELQTAIGVLAAHLEKLPLDELSGDLRHALQSASRLMEDADASLNTEIEPSLKQLRNTLASAERALAADSPLQDDTRRAMREVTRSAQAFRALADYLEQHPEAVLFGKREAGKK